MNSAFTTSKPRTPWYKSRYFWLVFYTAIGLAILCGTMAAELDVTYFGLAGGFFGAFCSGLVLVNIHYLDKKKRSASTSLLFWRALCDLGIGLRFVTGLYWNVYQCGHSLCNLDGENSKCWAPAGVLEFFELASEAWFFCVIMDLAVSVTDPFSAPKARLKKYHIFSWTVGTVFGLVVAFDSRVYGIWEVTAEVSNHGFCWIQNHTSSKDEVINYKPYVMFYIPIFIIYCYAIYVLSTSYQRLKLGISKTFQHRVTMLTVNAINVTVYFFYWTVCLFLYIFLSESAYSNPQAAAWVFDILMFCLASKGYVDLVVWILANEGRNSDNPEDENKINSTDFNAALREEVLHFATTGIRVCAQRASRATVSKRRVVLLMTQAESGGEGSVALSPWFFIKLMFGSEEKLDQLKAVMLRDSSVGTKGGGAMTGVGNDSTRGTTLASSTVRPSEVNGVRNSTKKIAVRSEAGEVLTAGLKDEILSEGEVEAAAVLNAMHTNQTGSSDKAMMLAESGRSILRNSFMKDSSMADVTDIRVTEMSEADVSRNYAPDSDTEDDVSSEQFNAASARSHSVFSNIFTRTFFPSHDNSKSKMQHDESVVKFTEFEPYYFRLVRQSADIDDDFYKHSFKNTIKERLTEGGASGAFFFFSKGEQFIAKSCTEEEMDALVENTRNYANYLCSQPQSFISKIYGAYKLHIYGTDLYFFVMNNLFLTSNEETINEKYDIKGSWVARNAQLPRDGQRVPCTFCNQTYVYSKSKTVGKQKKKRLLGNSPSLSRLQTLSSDNESCTLGEESPIKEKQVEDRCPFTVLGRHEPNVILKDNDLKHKIRLPLLESREVLEQLKCDAEFLCRAGIMDYSLLIGVHNTEYEVDDAVVISGLENEESFLEHKKSESESESSPSIRGSALKRRASVRTVFTPSVPTNIDNVKSKRGSSKKVRRLQVSRVVGPEAYYMGIIDFQQKWNLSKKAERFFKLNFKGADPAGLSSIDPVRYKDRFISRLEELLDVDENEEYLLENRAADEKTDNNIIGGSTISQI